MAHDPNEQPVSQGWWNPGYAEGMKVNGVDAVDVPPYVQLPDGIQRSKDFYAYYRQYKDGSVDIEWYRRNNGGGAGSGDSIITTSTAQLPQSPQEQAAAGRKEVRSYPGTDPGTGLPAIVTEYQDGSKSYDSSKPAQTNATASTGSNPRVPPGSVPQIEGTPIRNAQGEITGYDNNQPIRVWHTPPTQDNPQGGLIYDPLQPSEVLDWQRQKNGGLTDADVRQQSGSGTKTVPVDGYPGISQVTTARKDPQTNQSVEETHFENDQHQVVPDPRPATGQPATGRTSVPLDGYPGISQVTTARKDPTTNQTITETHFENAQNQTVPDPRPATNQTATGSKRIPVDGYPGISAVTTVTKDPRTNQTTEETHFENDQQQTVPDPRPSTARQYVRVQQDDQTGIWWGLKPNGDWEQTKGGPGAPTGQPKPQGPPMPAIVVGASQDAMRTYYNQLQAEVAAGRQTPAWATARWNEAKDMANLAITDANYLERQRESNMNASINLATTKLHDLSGSIDTALSFASSINGKLPPGSPLGGQAFAAILGLHLMAAKQSGIYDIKVPKPGESPTATGTGTSAAAAQPAPTLPNISDPAAVEASRQQVAAQTAAAAQPNNGVTNTTDAGGVPRVYTPASSSTGPATTTPPGSSGSAPTPAPSQPAAPSDNRMTTYPGPGSVMETQGAAALRPPVAASAPAPAPVTPDRVSNAQPDPSTLRVMRDATGGPPTYIGPDGAIYSTANGTYIQIGKSGQDAYNKATPPASPPAAGQPQGMTDTADDFPALATLQTTYSQPQGVTMTPDDSQQPGQPTRAELELKARTTPVWNLSEDEYNQMKAAGIDDSVIFSTPRSPMVAA